MTSPSPRLSSPVSGCRPLSRGRGARARWHSQQGMTLVEAMMATMVFTLGMLGVYMMLIKSYEMVALCRHRDNARAVLLSYCDQFQRLRTTDGSGTLGFMFQTASAPTSFGLSWTDAGNTTVSNYTDTSDTGGLAVTLGDSASSGIPARVFREVHPLLMTDGSIVNGSPSYTAAGYMLQATFTVTYQIKGRPLTQSLTVARSFR
ncbi:MAG: prepilin-type N-terminal cleavage/methylation domain-containing protein [Verrucomicrobiota bacterium]